MIRKGILFYEGSGDMWVTHNKKDVVDVVDMLIKEKKSPGRKVTTRITAREDSIP